MITRNNISELYQTYFKNREIEIILDNAAVNALDQQEWLSKVKERRKKKRQLFIENEAMLNLYLYPLFNNEDLMNDELAEELLTQIKEYWVNQNKIDDLMTLQVCLLLERYYEKRNCLNQLVYVRNLIGGIYSRFGTEEDERIAVEYFKKQFDSFALLDQLSDDVSKRALIYCLYNYPSTILDQEELAFEQYDEKFQDDLIDLTETCINLLNHPTVRASLPDFDFDGLVEEVKEDVYGRFLFSCSKEGLVSERMLQKNKEIIVPMYNKELEKDGDPFHMDTMLYGGYHKYLYYSHQIDADQLCKSMYYFCDYVLKNDSDINEDDDFENSRYFWVSMFMAPNMMELVPLIKKSKQEIVSRYSQEVVLSFVRKIPSGRMNGYVLSVLIDSVSAILEKDNYPKLNYSFIRDTLINHNELLAIKFIVVRKMAEAMLQSIFKNKPELLIGVKGTKDVVEVLKCSEKIEQMMDEACLVYDIGMLNFTPIYQLETRALTKHEIDTINLHMELGVKKLKKLVSDKDVLDIVHGHHKNSDETGIPQSFELGKSKAKILVEMIHLLDAIESGTDMLGRSYQTPSTFDGVFQRFKLDAPKRFNADLISLIENDEQLKESLRYICSGGRISSYFEIYQQYIINHKTIVVEKTKATKIPKRLEKENGQLNAFKAMAKAYEMIGSINLLKNTFEPVYFKKGSLFNSLSVCEMDEFFYQILMPLVVPDQQKSLSDALFSVSLANHINNGNGVYEREVQLKYATGYKWVRIQFIGEIERIGVIENVTMTIQEINNLYLQREQLMIALEVANEQAKKSNSAKTVFLSNMSHDIRTPLNAITGFNLLLQQHSNEPERIEEYSRKIANASNQLLELVNDVLDVSKIEAGKLDLHETELNLRELIQQAIENVRSIAEKNGQQLIVDIHLENENVIADSLRINQMLLNLLTNAIKYTPSGGTIQLKVNEQPQKSHLFGNYQFIIADNGIGMSEEYQQRIFQPFARERDPQTSKIQGTGLGLTIVKNVVEMMGGVIGFESKKNQGTTFDIQLQLRLSSNVISQQVVKHINDEEVFAGLAVLAVEDNELNAEILQELLELQGASVDVAYNGVEALEILKENPGKYELILMDIQMPVMNGYEATKAIRQLEDDRLNRIPIIAMTANAFLDDIQACFEAGMEAHVAKPLNMDILEKTVAEVLHRN